MNTRTSYSGVSDWWNWLLGSSGVSAGSAADANATAAQNAQIQSYIEQYRIMPAPPPTSPAVKVVAGVSVAVLVLAVGAGVKRRWGKRGG